MSSLHRCLFIRLGLVQQLFLPVSFVFSILSGLEDIASSIVHVASDGVLDTRENSGHSVGFQSTGRCDYYPLVSNSLLAPQMHATDGAGSLNQC